MNLGWSPCETCFVIVAILVLASGIFGVGQMFFRPKKKPPVPQQPRKHRVSYVVEEIVERDAKSPAAKIDCA